MNIVTPSQVVKLHVTGCRFIYVPLKAFGGGTIVQNFVSSTFYSSFLGIGESSFGIYPIFGKFPASFAFFMWEEEI
jgi:hypothetical protein